MQALGTAELTDSLGRPAADRLGPHHGRIRFHHTRTHVILWTHARAHTHTICSTAARALGGTELADRLGGPAANRLVIRACEQIAVVVDTKTEHSPRVAFKYLRTMCAV